MRCVNPKCYGTPRSGSNLCATCRGILDSTLVVGVCIGMCALIVCLAKVGRML